MGLGLFIAKTLLERSGAELSFANGNNSGAQDSTIGAIVEVMWPLEAINQSEDVSHQALGENRLIET